VKKILFLDFEDSFTFNVVQELTEIGLEVETIHWTKFTEMTNHDLLVLGPGPGHPDDYASLYPLISEWMLLGKKIFGVCLGHQILWRMKGRAVAPSLKPLHGQKIELTLNQEWQRWLGLPAKTLVQRYNSLAVMADEEVHDSQNFILDGEIIMSKNFQFISYQFHPESMGTKCRDAFFRPILRDLL
jgi:anthranilate/para-aminobenzoate synthase component II